MLQPCSLITNYTFASCPCFKGQEAFEHGSKSFWINHYCCIIMMIIIVVSITMNTNVHGWCTHVPSMMPAYGIMRQYDMVVVIEVILTFIWIDSNPKISYTSQSHSMLIAELLEHKNKFRELHHSCHFSSAMRRHFHTLLKNVEHVCMLLEWVCSFQFCVIKLLLLAVLCCQVNVVWWCCRTMYADAIGAKVTFTKSYSKFIECISLLSDT